MATFTDGYPIHVEMKDFDCIEPNLVDPENILLDSNEKQLKRKVAVMESAAERSETSQDKKSKEIFKLKNDVTTQKEEAVRMKNKHKKALDAVIKNKVNIIMLNHYVSASPQFAFIYFFTRRTT